MFLSIIIPEKDDIATTRQAVDAFLDFLAEDLLDEGRCLSQPVGNL
jgi:hypothetical protein